jgi:hypothetical protein
MKKIFDWIIEKWLAGFITASFFFTLRLYIDLPTESKNNFFSFKWLTDLLKTQISLSIVSIIIIAIIILTRIEKSLLKSKKNSVDYNFLKAPKNHFETYRRDTFGVNKTTWTWNYEWKAYEQKFFITDLKPTCRQCGTPMEINTFFSSNSAECHKCRLEGKQSYFDLREHIADVEKEIIRRIQKNEVNL